MFFFAIVLTDRVKISQVKIFNINFYILSGVADATSLYLSDELTPVLKLGIISPTEAVGSQKDSLNEPFPDPLTI